MYPFIRLAKEMFINRNASALPITGTHVSYHRCWPQDLDAFMEMNNGRILTILDLGRIALGQRSSLLGALKANSWGLTMAGNSVRYRKRIKPFVRFKLVSRAVGWDARFMYLEQSIWIDGECAVQALFRAAVTDKNGIVEPSQIIEAMDQDITSPALPTWVQNWIDADATRPWPPQVGQD
ncbi:MAG: acyl-CoA thioesterase FadM [Gammaproteobacteria bacterium]|jgi:acyl-CoA thioesterase FadM